MTLAAAQAVNAVAARMSAAGLVAHTSRLWPLAESALPAWRITADAEDAEQMSVGDDIHRHTLSINCRGIARATDDLDDVLHAMAATAMAAIFAQPVPFDLSLTGIDRELATEGEATVGAITVTVRAAFYVRASAPEIILS